MKTSKTGLAAVAALLVLASSAQASVHGDGSMGDWILLMLVFAAPWLILCVVVVVLLVFLVKRLGRSSSNSARVAERQRD